MPGDAETQNLVHSFEMGSTIQSQQNGAVWASENRIVSIGLDGILNILDPREGKSHKIYVSEQNKHAACCP
jgi:deoxycytidylate deaminase